jgi:4-hydroxy-4-methyl-2-oxoglutarate aldolase
VERFAELSGPPLVVFQDLDHPTVAATFGEVMCTVYQSFGAVGLVSSGAGRDLDQVRKLGFPVFTNGTVCAHGYLHLPSLHVPVHVGGLAVYPDDLLHADCNGVTTIPREIADEVAEIGDEFMAAEAIVLDALRGTKGELQRLRELRRESKGMIEKLRARVSRAKQMG